MDKITGNISADMLFVCNDKQTACSNNCFLSVIYLFIFAVLLFF